MIQAAPYIGVLAAVVCCWIYLRRSVVPVAASGWRSARVAEGDCPKEHCGGKTYMVAAETYQTLWRCAECRQGYLLSSLPRE